jgi:tetratricopeptide (TPR) repeat protein
MIDRLRPGAAVLLAVALFAVYAAGACPTIYVGDSGELAAAVGVLGIPHPSGYPLYVLLGKLWTVLVPIGSIAYRLSLFSAACAALACVLLYRSARLLRLPQPAALLSALLLAFAPSFWGEANVQRVYALNALFVALATFSALRWYTDRDPRWWAATLFVCGLGAANHTFMAVYAAAFAAATVVRVAVRARRVGVAVALRRLGLIWGRDPQRRGTAGALATFAASAFLFLLGLLPYLYLPLRARADPPLNWGDPQTLDRFLAVVLRRGFWERAWYEQPADLIIVVRDYLASMATELTWMGATLALAGLLGGRRAAWPRFLCASVMIGNLAVMAAHGSRSDLFIWHRYYIPSYAMAALLAGCGCRFLLAALPRTLQLAPLAVPALMLVLGWPAADRSRYRIADAYSRAMLQSLPPGATLVATDDNVLFVLLYLTIVEQLRPDVHLVQQGVDAADLPPLRFNPDTDAVFFTHHPNWNRDDLDVTPVGMVFQIRRPGRPGPALAMPFTELPGERDDAVPKDYLTRNLIGQLHYMLGFTLEQRDWRRARAEFDRAAAISPDNDVLFYNLGLIYQRNGLLDEALAAFTRAQAINPRHIASASRPRPADRVAAVAAERARIAAIERSLASEPALSGLVPGSRAHHLRLAELLVARGESVAAHGHRLRALGQDAEPNGRASE